jgi:RNA polymerase sigma factor (sigma-70 family)
MSDPQMKPDVRANDQDMDSSPRECAKGEADFDWAVAECHQRIRLLVYRLLGWRDGIEDVVQDVFLAAWAAWPRFRRRTSVELWLKRIAANKCRSRLRREAVRARWLGWIRGSFKNKTHAPADQLLDQQEQAERVRSAVCILKPVYRETTVLHYLEQLSIDEIAEVLGVRRNTVEVRLHRARKQLEKILADMME